jgi:glycosyltransferase involved in cell wall biosynthesis
VLYNAIDDNLEPDATPVQPDKLVFMSSPHKGLEQTLRVFGELRAHEALRDVVLHVANPGYLRTYDTSAMPNVVNLGPLPQRVLMRHVREALCAFHWNFVYPETFGIVHAECHAVGTPFLSSALGANPELMEHPEECLALEDASAALARLVRWREGHRPCVRGRSNFRTGAVVARWVETLAARREHRCRA